MRKVFKLGFLVYITMAETYVIDTCIWRDFYEDRVSRTGLPLGKYASGLFTRIMQRKDRILFSEALVLELSKDYDKKDIVDMLSVLFVSKVLFRIEITNEEYLEAKKLSLERNIPFIDCLNAVHARDHDAVLVSQDSHIIESLKDIAKVRKPQQII